MSARGLSFVGVGVVALVALAPPARAEEFVLADGEVLSGVVTSSTDETLSLQFSDDTVRVLRRDEIVQRRSSRDERSRDAEKPRSRPVASPPTPAPRREDGGQAALRRAAREGLAERARVSGGAFELKTCVPLRAAEGTFSVSATPRPIDLDTAICRDRTVDQVGLELWDARGATPEERFYALKLVAGAIVWVEATVTAVSPDGSTVSLDITSSAARQKTRVRLPGLRAQPQDRIRIPAVLVLAREEASRFLLAQGGGETLGRWPFECILLVGQVESTTPSTVSTGASSDRLATRALETRAREWLRARERIGCEHCGGTRRIACDLCNGKGVVEKLFIPTFVKATGQAREDDPPVGWTFVTCSRCGGKGWRTCLGCTDGLDELELSLALRKFGAYGRALASFLDAGVKVDISADGKSATLTALVRYRDRPHDEPVLETTHWTLDLKGVWTLVDATEGGGTRAAPSPWKLSFSNS
jgi:hypothetical protein